MWSFPELFHTLVPSRVLLPVLEGQPSSLSYPFRKPFLMLLVSFGCLSSCSHCIFHSSVTAPSTKYYNYLSFSFTGLWAPQGWGNALFICIVPALYQKPNTYECNVWICMHEWMDGWCRNRAMSKLKWETTENRPGEGRYLTSRRAFWAAWYQARLTREASFWSDRGRKLRIYVSIWRKKIGHGALLDLMASGTFSNC